MEKLIDLISEQVSAAFQAAGYEASYGRVSVSGRPDLCEYQCNGSLPAAKVYKKAPIVIAEEIVEKLAENPAFSTVEAVKPGFINLRLAPPMWQII
jgi:arginyl-tRNA synthetase